MTDLPMASSLLSPGAGLVKELQRLAASQHEQWTYLTETLCDAFAPGGKTNGLGKVSEDWCVHCGEHRWTHDQRDSELALRSAAQSLQAATERAEQAERERAKWEDVANGLGEENENYLACYEELKAKLEAADQVRVEALALVEQWRKEASLMSWWTQNVGRSAVEKCADQLASLLTRPPTER